jgi:predicted nucleic acid-binding protein
VTLVLDTSGLLSAIDSDQRLHEAARTALLNASGPLLLSPFVLAELDYLLAERVGQREELALLGEVERETYRLEPFSARDVAEARRVIERYADLGLGLADGTWCSPDGTGRGTCSPSTSGTSALSPGRETSPSGCSPRISSPNPRAAVRCAGYLRVLRWRGAFLFPGEWVVWGM